MGRSLFIAEGKNVSVTSANAVIQAKQQRAAVLNGIVKGELVLGASLNAYTSLFTQYVLNASLDAYTVPGTTLINGIQRYYKLDSDAVDSVAAQNGTTPNVTWVTGKFGTAANFNADTSRQIVAPSLDLMTAITISAWVYFTGSNSFSPVVCQMSSGGGATLNYAILTNGTGLTFYGTGNASSASCPAMSQNMWHHVVATRTIGGLAQFWIDGVAGTATAGPAPHSVPGASFRIGNRDDNYADFPGYIDEVGVWNRVLTASEIAELFNHQVGQTYPFGVRATLLTQIGAYWKLDGNSTDELATANGTDTNVTYSVGNGKLSQGAGFDGTTSKVVLPNVASLKPTTITASAWIKTTEAGSYRTLVNSTHQVSTVCGWELRKNSSNKLEFLVGNNTNLVQGSGYQFSASTQNINDGVWHHVCGTYDGGYVRTYIDGVLDGAVAFAGGAIAYDSDPRVRIGVNNYVGSTEVYFWSGALDEIGVWSRALDAEEILSLYNAGLGEQYPFTTPAPTTTSITAYYKMDGSSVDSLGTYSGSDSAGLTYSGANGIINSGVGGFSSASTRITLSGIPALPRYSISMWINPTSLTGTGYGGLLTQSGTYTALYLRSTGKIVFYFSSADHASTASITLGVWTHVVLTANPLGWSLYLNGVLDSSGVAAVTSIAPTQIGNDAANDYYNGAIDEIGLWSRVLTATEVTALYNSGVGIQYPF